MRLDLIWDHPGCCGYPILGWHSHDARQPFERSLILTPLDATRPTCMPVCPRIEPCRSRTQCNIPTQHHVSLPRISSSYLSRPTILTYDLLAIIDKNCSVATVTMMIFIFIVEGVIPSSESYFGSRIYVQYTYMDTVEILNTVVRSRHFSVTACDLLRSTRPFSNMISFLLMV